MYYTINKNHNPRQPLFAWDMGNSFAYHLPNREQPRQVIRAESYHRANSKLGCLPDDLAARVSGIYDYYLLTIENYKEQLESYRNFVFEDPSYTEAAKRNFLSDEAKRLKVFRQELSRKTLKRIADRLRRARNQKKGASPSLEFLYLIISFVLAVRIPCDMMKEMSATERLASWLKDCWIVQPATQVPAHKSLEDRETQLTVDLLHVRLEKILHDLPTFSSLPKYSGKLQSQKLKKATELIAMKLQARNNHDFPLATETQRKEMHNLVKRLAQEQIDQGDKKKPMNDVADVVFLALSGDMKFVKLYGKESWKLCLLFYLTYRDPFTPYAEIPSIVQSFASQQDSEDEESMLAIKLFQPSLHAVVQWSLRFVPLVLAVTFGLICLDNGLLRTCFDREVLGCSYRHYLLGLMTGWMTQTELPVAMVYARQYGHQLQLPQYTEFFTNLVSRKVELRPIATKEEYGKVMGEFLTIRELHLTDYLIHFTRSLVLWQIKNNTFEYLFELLAIHEDSSNLKEPLCWLRHHSDSLLKEREFDYTLFALAVNNLKVERYHIETVTRVFQVYLMLSDLEVAGPETFIPLFEEFLEHPRVITAFGCAIDILHRHIMVPDSGKDYLPCLKTAKEFLVKHIDTANNEAEIKQLARELDGLEPPQ